jgi:hypothetical protein
MLIQIKIKHTKHYQLIAFEIYGEKKLTAKILNARNSPLPFLLTIEAASTTYIESKLDFTTEINYFNSIKTSKRGGKKSYHPDVTGTEINTCRTEPKEIK